MQKGSYVGTFLFCLLTRTGLYDTIGVMEVIRMAETEKRICEFCGKEYSPKAYWQRYCSNACKQKAKRARAKEKQLIK